MFGILIYSGDLRKWSLNYQWRRIKECMYLFILFLFYLTFFLINYGIVTIAIGTTLIDAYIIRPLTPFRTARHPLRYCVPSAQADTFLTTGAKPSPTNQPILFFVFLTTFWLLFASPEIGPALSCLSDKVFNLSSSRLVDDEFRIKDVCFEAEPIRRSRHMGSLRKDGLVRILFTTPN